MKTKPKPKTCYSRRVVCYSIADLKRTELPSVTKAAAFCGMSQSWFSNILKNSGVANGYSVAYIEDEEKAKYQAERLHRAERKKQKAEESKQERVPLRIDARTVIYVRHENATPEYAEQYRQLLGGKRR